MHSTQQANPKHAVFEGGRVFPAFALLVGAALLAAACAPQQHHRARRIAASAPQPRAARAVPIAATPPAVALPYVPWGEHTVETRLAEIGGKARAHWKRYFDGAGILYPPASVVLVVFKRERRVEVYAGTSPYHPVLLRQVAITAASGNPGPKLREGDRQVPEGVYEIEALNPNSMFHLALRLAYPNTFDQLMAAQDRRERLGGSIMIHGGEQSIGCVAVGDEAIEDLFVIAADAGIENVSVVIVPRDFRRTGETGLMPGQPTWVHELYAELDLRLRSLPAAAPAVPPATVGSASGRATGGLATR